MNCDESRDLMLDILYGEELSSRTCFQFFQHIDACAECSGEYGELLQTREMLQSWQVDDSKAVPELATNLIRPVPLDPADPMVAGAARRLRQDS